MKSGEVRILTNNRAEELFLKAILKPRVDQGQIRVDSYLLSDAAISIARQSLLEHPERPVALVLNADTTDSRKASRDRGSVERILGSAYPLNWFVALVVPKVSAWALADPRIKSDFETGKSTRTNYYEQAVRIGELVKETPFDVDALRRVSPEFRGLEDFINRYAGAPKAAVKSVLN
jgi:hypothetical protein